MGQSLGLWVMATGVLITTIGLAMGVVATIRWLRVLRVGVPDPTHDRISTLRFLYSVAQSAIVGGAGAVLLLLGGALTLGVSVWAAALLAAAVAVVATMAIIIRGRLMRSSRDTAHSPSQDG